MRDQSFIRLAMQKSGRLHKKSMELLAKSGMTFEGSPHLLTRCQEFPLEAMLVRDDDIPDYLNTGVCDIGIIGLNELKEKIPTFATTTKLKILKRLGFGKCRLALAVPEKSEWEGLMDFQGKKIATSYPNITQAFLDKENLDCQLIKIAGSVEVAPAIGLADAVCDLVSTGATLSAHGLREVHTVLDSEAVLVGNDNIGTGNAQKTMNRFQQRVNGVLQAQKACYIMMNAPKESIDIICQILPGLEKPTILPLGNQKKVAIHAVAYEDIFWETMEDLKSAGASSILVVPIEKIIE